MAEASYLKASTAKTTLANSLDKYLKSAEEKRTEINSTFDALIEIANTRRLTLLFEVDNEVALVEEEVKKRQIVLGQLENTELDIDKNLSGNQVRQAMTTELCNQINNVNLNLPYLKLKWSNGSTRIINNFDLICQLLIYTESPFELENNNSPIWISDLKCGNGVNEITEAKSVAIDPITHNIYLGDASGKKILIFNKLGEHLKSLDIKKDPSSIDLVWLGRTEIKSPYLKKGRLWKSEVRDMVSANGHLVMLLLYAELPIQAFDISGCLLWGMNLENYSVTGEQFLCVDAHWNIIIVSSQNILLRVYNKDGKRIGKIGQIGQERGDVYYPRGIALDVGGNLIVCDCKKKFLLQAY